MTLLSSLFIFTWIFCKSICTSVTCPETVTKIAATDCAFAAIRSDGSVVTWGPQEFGGDRSAVAGQLFNNVVGISSNRHAFAALQRNGSVVTWGWASKGGDSSLVADQLSGNIVSIFSTESAFAAIKSDGSVVTWGSADAGGNSSLVADQISSEVISISSTVSAFAAIKRDGSVMTWGSSSSGGDSDSAAGELSANVVGIYSTLHAFAAVKGDGSVVTWGNSCPGFETESMQCVPPPPTPAPWTWTSYYEPADHDVDVGELFKVIGIAIGVVCGACCVLWILGTILDECSKLECWRRLCDCICCPCRVVCPYICHPIELACTAFCDCCEVVCSPCGVACSKACKGCELACDAMGKCCKVVGDCALGCCKVACDSMWRCLSFSCIPCAKALEKCSNCLQYLKPTPNSDATPQSDSGQLIGNRHDGQDINVDVDDANRTREEELRLQEGWEKLKAEKLELEANRKQLQHDMAEESSRRGAELEREKELWQKEKLEWEEKQRVKDDLRKKEAEELEIAYGERQRKQEELRKKETELLEATKIQRERLAREAKEATKHENKLRNLEEELSKRENSQRQELERERKQLEDERLELKDKQMRQEAIYEKEKKQREANRRERERLVMEADQLENERERIAAQNLRIAADLDDLKMEWLPAIAAERDVLEAQKEALRNERERFEQKSQAALQELEEQHAQREAELSEWFSKIEAVEQAQADSWKREETLRMKEGHLKRREEEAELLEATRVQKKSLQMEAKKLKDERDQIIAANRRHAEEMRGLRMFNKATEERLRFAEEDRQRMAEADERNVKRLNELLVEKQQLQKDFQIERERSENEARADRLADRKQFEAREAHLIQKLNRVQDNIADYIGENLQLNEVCQYLEQERRKSDDVCGGMPIHFERLRREFPSLSSHQLQTRWDSMPVHNPERDAQSRSAEGILHEVAHLLPGRAEGRISTAGWQCLRLPGDKAFRLKVPPSFWGISLAGIKSFLRLFLTECESHEDLQPEMPVRDMVKSFIKPRYKSCSVALSVMAAPVRIRWLVSHCWEEATVEFLEDVISMCTEISMSEDEGIFICFLSVFQGTEEEILTQVTQNSDDIFHGCFAKVLQSVKANRGAVLVVSNEKLVLQGSGLYSRLWCGWEAFQAFYNQVLIQIHPKRATQAHLFGTGDLCSQSLENGSCGPPHNKSKADIENEKQIKAAIRDKGGFHKVDAILKELCHVGIDADRTLRPSLSGRLPESLQPEIGQ